MAAHGCQWQRVLDDTVIVVFFVVKAYFNLILIVNFHYNNFTSIFYNKCSDTLELKKKKVYKSQLIALLYG